MVFFYKKHEIYMSFDEGKLGIFFAFEIEISTKKVEISTKRHKKS